MISADLRRVALHEAGHACVAEHMSGTPATITIWRDGSTAAPVQGLCSHPGAAAAPWRTAFGLAGACAEIIVSPHRSCTGHALANAVAARMSQSDSEIAGAYSWADMDECLALCHGLWYRIAARAEREIGLFAHSQRLSVGLAA